MTTTIKIGSIILIALILVINAITLLRYPAPNSDDAWMASRAWEFTKSGNSFGPLDIGVLDRYEDYENFYPWLSSAIQSLGIRLFGTPSLLAIRFVSIIFGSILLIAVYWIGIALDGKQLGILCVAFTAFSLAFLLSSHLGRPDIIAATFGYIGIALYLNNRSANIWISVLVGLIVSLAFEVHPNAIIFSLTIATLFFYKYKWNIVRKIDFWGFIAGGMIGILIYLYLHVFPNPQTFISLYKIVFSSTHIPPIFTADLEDLWQAIPAMGLLLVYTYPLIILGFWAVFRFRKQRPTYITILLVINTALILSFTLLVRNKFLLYYAIYFSPGLTMLVAAFFNDFVKSPTRNQFEYNFRLTIVSLICLLPLFQVIKFDPPPNYQQVQLRVNQAVKPGATIMGNQLYWFGLRDHRYYSWENLVFYMRDKPGSRLENAFRALKPDFFILDSQVRYYTFDGDKMNNYFQQFQVPKSELETFLNQYAELETIIEESSGGKFIEIYHIDWENQSSYFEE